MPSPITSPLTRIIQINDAIKTADHIAGNDAQGKKSTISNPNYDLEDLKTNAKNNPPTPSIFKKLTYHIGTVVLFGRRF